MPETVNKRPLTPIEEKILTAVSNLRMLPGTNRKRFIRQMVEARRGKWGFVGSEPQPEPFMMTERQIAFMCRIAWRHRRQLTPEIAAMVALKGGAEPPA